jgi:hypothetical protein
VIVDPFLVNGPVILWLVIKGNQISAGGLHLFVLRFPEEGYFILSDYIVQQILGVGVESFLR